VYEWDFDMVVGLKGVIGTLSVPNDGGRVYAASADDAALIALERFDKPPFHACMKLHPHPTICHTTDI
jgi:hypothetical protein